MEIPLRITDNRTKSTLRKLLFGLFRQMPSTRRDDAARTLSAEQKGMPVIGFLSGGAPDSSKPYVAAFRKGLTEAGYGEGRNVAIEYRWQEGRYNHAPAMAAELVDRGVTVIVASGGPASAFAAKAATTTIPILFVSGTDPVESGLVASLNHPGGNITGVTFF